MEARQVQSSINLTSTYPFAALSVGDYFTVEHRFQHCRVAASEYGRKHRMVFSCRMQEDRTMRVYRVEANQANVDVRGRQGKRRIPTIQPTRDQFFSWLWQFKPGMTYKLPASYGPQYGQMVAWCAEFSFLYQCSIVGHVDAASGCLHIHA